MNQLYPQYLPLITPILSGLISLFASYCGFRWSKGASDKRERQLSEERLISSTLKTRQDAYAKIYEELCTCRSYFELFIESGNEFKEQEDTEKFGPLTLNLDFLKTYRKHEIWVHSSTKEKFQQLFNKMSILNNIALYNALHILKMENGEESGEFPHNIEMHCKETIEIIDNIRNHIVSVNGLTQLDKHVDSILS